MPQLTEMIPMLGTVRYVPAGINDGHAGGGSYLPADIDDDHAGGWPLFTL
jgi:hypothetical protein